MILPDHPHELARLIEEQLNDYLDDPDMSRTITDKPRYRITSVGYGNKLTIEIETRAY